MRLFCHHTDGQKAFSCHGNKMYSATNEKEIYKREVFVLPVVISWQQMLNLSFIVLKLQQKILQTMFLLNTVFVSCRLPAICLQISLLWEALAFSSLVIYLDMVSLSWMSTGQQAVDGYLCSHEVAPRWINISLLLLTEISIMLSMMGCILDIRVEQELFRL